MNDRTREMAKNTLVVAGATLVSRVFGFVRDVIVAFALGAGAMADAFFVAFRIPNLLRRLFGEGSLTMAFVPVFAQVRAEQGEQAAQAMARSALAWLAAILVGVTLVVECFAGGLVWAIAPGFTDDPALYAATTLLLRICFPYIILISGVALCMGILNASGHFLGPALAPVLLNVALITASLAGYYLGLPVAVCLAWGVLAGGVLQWQLQQPFLRRQGFTWRGAWTWRDAGVRRMAWLMLPTVFGAAVYQLNILLGTLLASFLPEGSVSYLYYADRLVQFPLGVFGVAVSTAALPSLAALVAEGDDPAYLATLRSALGLTLFVALPATAGLAALAGPIIDLLFGRGAFTPQAVAATSTALVAYAAGLPFIAASRPLVSAFYARQDTRTPVRVAVLCLLLNVCLGWALMLPLGHVGLALAVSISSAANAVLLGLALRRKEGERTETGEPVRLVPRSLWWTLALSAGVFAGAWATRTTSWLWAAMIPAWVAAYLGGARLLGVRPAVVLLDVLGRRLSGRLPGRLRGRGN
ncbi:MAG: murein biosynthesis integral membrane protein MurJ [Desulfovibrionaceae bacterium]